MRFIKNENQRDIEDFVLVRISQLLEKHQNITWMITGGSNIKLIAAVYKRLSTEQLGKITIILSDERYGVHDHPDSNFFQLKQTGIDLSYVKYIEVLSKSDPSIEETATRYADAVEKLFSHTEFIFATLGMGPDGHIAGILPNSPAADIEDKLATYYISDPYKRITLTFPALRKISELILIAVDDKKYEALINLRDKKLSLKDQPAQICSEITESYIINKSIGGDI